MSNHITGHTGLLCLLGSPVAHSVSPEMHNEACSQLGLDYTYLAFDVPEEKMPQAVEGLRTMGARGWNITMPGKNIMCKLADKVSPASEISGACNTIVNDDGVLTAYTTDGVGFMRAVAENGVDIIGKKMTLLGAGGAATAILVQAALDGVAEINVFNVKDAFYPRAEEIVKKLNIDAFVVGDDWYGKYDYLKELGVQVFYFPYGTGVSSTNLKKTIHDSYEANLRSQRQAKPNSVKGFTEK